MAKARLSDRIALSFKDHVRSVQFQIRRRAGASRPSPSQMPLQAAKAMDALVSGFQSAAIGMFPESLRRTHNFAFPGTLSAYFGPESDELRNFTPEIYCAIIDLMRRFSDGECLVSEALVEEVYDRMRERHSVAISDALAGDFCAVIAACAALAAEIAATRPIQAWDWAPNQVSLPRHFLVSPNQYVAFLIGLSISVKSRAVARQDETPLTDEDILNLVDLAVDARFSELSAAITSRNPSAYLTKAFAEMLPFIA